MPCCKITIAWQDKTESVFVYNFVYVGQTKTGPFITYGDSLNEVSSHVAGCSHWPELLKSAKAIAKWERDLENPGVPAYGMAAENRRLVAALNEAIAKMEGR